MSEKESKVLQEEAQARRDFLKKAGAIGATAPAVALLLSAKPARAEAMISNAATDPYCISDIRLKRDIALLSRLDNGLGQYRYRYLWSDQVYVGVMAQEVEKNLPDAVAALDIIAFGRLAVNEHSTGTSRHRHIDRLNIVENLGEIACQRKKSKFCKRKRKHGAIS